MSAAFLFAGPTLARLRRFATADLGGLEVRPPIQRGELEALVRRGAAGSAIIVDGLFHLGQLAVGHLELRCAIEAGWRVWGLSSMGAIRAAEMAPLGMRGFGRVHRRFAEDPHFRDDEVALLHEPQPPWRELSEPLVHLREAVLDLVARGELEDDRGRAIIEDHAQRWFGERTLLRFRDQLAAAGVPAARAAGLIAAFDGYRVKALDLLDFLRQRPDLHEDPCPT
jgi:hypothetical protein